MKNFLLCSALVLSFVGFTQDQEKFIGEWFPCTVKHKNTVPNCRQYQTTNKNSITTFKADSSFYHEFIYDSFVQITTGRWYVKKRKLYIIVDQENSKPNVKIKPYGRIHWVNQNTFYVKAARDPYHKTKGYTYYIRNIPALDTH